ncbi:MAG TPA: threonine dehydratase [Granulicella sp.]|nr:threonine dehydratase [Granulicella sp.]
MAEGLVEEIVLPRLEEIRRAAEVVYRAMPATPQYTWPLLNQRAGAEVWVKHENHTPVGAFKIRGGLVYMDWLRRARPEVETVIAATRGNHGQSIAFAAGQVGVRAVIVVPEGNSREKNHAMRALGAELVEFGQDFQAASEHALELATVNGWHRIPSFDQKLVAGVATYALEFLTACPELETVYVPIGMGSGIAGMMAVRDALGLKTKIVGVVSSHAPAMALSFAAGEVIEHAATTAIADGVACRRPDATCLDFVRAGVERIVSVSDAEVENAMRVYFSDTHQVAEGAGAIGLGALLQERENGRLAAGSRAGTVLGGGNVDSDMFAAVLGHGTQA